MQASSLTNSYELLGLETSNELPTHVRMTQSFDLSLNFELTVSLLYLLTCVTVIKV